MISFDSLWCILNYDGCFTISMDALRERPYRKLYHHYYWLIAQKEREKKQADKNNGDASGKLAQAESKLNSAQNKTKPY